MKSRVVACLTETEERSLAWFIAKGHSKEDAIRRAGLVSSSRVYNHLRTKEWAQQLRAAINDRLSTELAPKAIALLEKVMDDEKMPARVRVEAAKTVLDRSGFAAVTKVASDIEEDAELAGMTQAELLKRIADLQRKIKARNGVTIDGEVVEAEEVTRQGAEEPDLEAFVS